MPGISDSEFNPSQNCQIPCELVISRNASVRRVDERERGSDGVKHSHIVLVVGFKKDMCAHRHRVIVFVARGHTVGGGVNGREGGG